MSQCYCDFDPPEFSHREIRRARKPHKCYECGGQIVPAEHYEHMHGKWDGDIYSMDTCQRCIDIRTWVTNNVPCVCWAYGTMIEDCKSAIEEAAYRAPEETKGLRFGFLRRIVIRDRINQTLAMRDRINQRSV